MKEFLPFHIPEIGEEEIESIVATLRSGWLTTGPKVKQFQEKFAERVGAQHAIALNSCTAALHLALEAIGISEGDEVIVPTMTFAATAEVVTYFKAKPVFVDCCADTLNIDVAKIEQVITPRTKAIIPVHFAGHPCQMNRILEIANAYHLRVIEDAAHALPAKFRGKTIGSIGDITCFSFYATKSITTGEGGMATTDNPEWADRMRTMSLHGLTNDPWRRYTTHGSWQYTISSPGFKYNMTDLAAALGIPQLKKCDRFWEVRRTYARLYEEGLKESTAIRVPHEADGSQHAWHLYVIQLDMEQLRIGRDECIEILKKNNIGVSVHFIPLHLHAYYRNTFGYLPKDFPVASSVFERIISLPLYPQMTEADVQNVVGTMREIVRQFRR